MSYRVKIRRRYRPDEHQTFGADSELTKVMMMMKIDPPEPRRKRYSSTVKDDVALGKGADTDLQPGDLLQSNVFR